MEDLTPTLNLILVVREALERGDSLRTALAEFIENDKSDLKLFLIGQIKPGHKLSRPLKETERNILSVLQRGLEGEPILPILKELEQDLVERSEAEIEEFTQKLTLRSLLPLLLLVFPGYLILLLGPTLESLLISLE